MITRNATGFHRALIGAIALAATGLTAMPAAAQDNPEARIRKLEAEVRALQRSVFPGGDGRYFEPEISSATPSRPATGAPSTTAAHRPPYLFWLCLICVE